MPVGITVDDVGSVWFIDRGADMLGYLDRSNDTFTLYHVLAFGVHRTGQREDRDDPHENQPCHPLHVDLLSV
jgi:hypothetical protein